MVLKLTTTHLAFVPAGGNNKCMTKITKQDANLIETQVDEELVVVNLANGEFYSLKETGLAIWQAIDGARDEDALVGVMQAEFGLPQQEVAADIQAFLADLEQNGFIEPR